MDGELVPMLVGLSMISVAVVVAILIADDDLGGEKSDREP